MKKHILIFCTIICCLYHQRLISLVSNKIILKNKSPLLIKHYYNKNRPIIIKSDKVEGSYLNYLIFSGNVYLYHNNDYLFSDKIKLINNLSLTSKYFLKKIEALGNIYYYSYSNNIIFNASKISINFINNNSSIWYGKYHLINKKFYGSADQIFLSKKNNYIILKNGYFTLCGNNGWNVFGSKIIHDHNNGITKIWNAYLRVNKIPIFYIPYFKLSSKSSHNSSFLLPKIKYSSINGIEFTIPYYFNINKKLNVVIIPHYINKYGLQIQNKFKSKTNFSNNLVSFDYLYSNKNNKNYLTHRWFLNWKHTSTYKNNWSLNANITKISDFLYFNDFNNKNFNNEYINEKIDINFINKNFNFSILLNNFTDFSNKKNIQYLSYPQINFYSYPKKFSFLNVSFNAQLSQIKNLNNYYPRIIRLHIEPIFNIIFSNKLFRSNFESKFSFTHYQQNNINNFDKLKSNMSIKHSINRIIPQFKIDNLIFLSKNLQFKKQYLQIIEPHLQYLYIPDYNQNNIYSYDSSLLLRDYLGLFRSQKYTGIDRIASDNRITTGITSHIYDDNFNEIFNISLGEMYSFNSSIYQEKQKNNIKNNFILANDIYWKINKNLNFSNNIQYDNNISHITQNNILLEYLCNKNYKIQFSYRYNNFKNILNNFHEKNKNILNNKSYYQIGEIAYFNFFHHFSIVNSYFYDIKHHKKINQLIGLEYDSYCYAVFFTYEKKLNFFSKNLNQYNYKFTFNFELRGFERINNINKINTILEKIFIPLKDIF